MAGMKGGRMRGGVVAKGAIKKGTFPRLMKYVFKYYKWHLLAVLLCLVVSAGGGLVSSLFMQKNIDDIMNPGIVNGYERADSARSSSSWARVIFSRCLPRLPTTASWRW